MLTGSFPALDRAVSSGREWVDGPLQTQSRQQPRCARGSDDRVLRLDELFAIRNRYASGSYRVLGRADGASDP